MKKNASFIFHFSLFMAVLCCGMPQSKAAGRATEILEKLAAGFRAMPGYSVDFEVSAGDYKSRGSYVVEGRCYYLVLADAEVFADSVVRYEIDNRRREVTVTEVDAASRNILNNPVRAFDFLGSEYTPSLVSEADGRAVVRLTPAAGNDSPAGSVTVTENRPPPSDAMGRSVSSPVNGCSRSVMSAAPAFSAARYTSVPVSAAPNGRRKALFLDSCTIM